MNLTARDLLDRLVAFPTVSDTSNLALVDFVEGSEGANCSTLETAP